MSKVHGSLGGLFFSFSALLVTVFLASVLLASAAEQPGTNFSTATELAEGDYSFFLDVGDLHFFKVRLERGETLIVTLRMPVREDFDIVLLGPARDLLERGIKPAGLTERIGVLASESGYYYIVVTAFGRSSGTYTLTIDILKPSAETVTRTETVISSTTVTETQYMVHTVTVTVERMVTLTEAVEREVESIPWSMLGLIAVALAIIYAGFSFSSRRVG